MTDPATILSESLLSLAQAAKRLPPSRRGAPVSLGCVLRWVLDGARGPDGQMVKLEAVRVGARWLTSVQALARFAQRLTPQLHDSPVSSRTPQQRRRAAEQAEAELTRMGL